MISCGMKEVADLKRYSAPTVTPQAVEMWSAECGLWNSAVTQPAEQRGRLEGLGSALESRSFLVK
jgi:hypothetical protein